MSTSSKKTPWHLRFAPKAKGIVSFVQNLLSPLTRKECVRGGQVSAFFQSAAAVVVGIGLLAGSNGEVHGQSVCYPPGFDVCLHKEGSWESSSGKFTVEIGLEGKSWQLYEVVCHGLKKIGGKKPTTTLAENPIRVTWLSRTRTFVGITSSIGRCSKATAVPSTRGITIGIIQMKTVFLLGFVGIGLLPWISTLIMKRRLFPSTILPTALILDCLPITAPLIGNRFFLIRSMVTFFLDFRPIRLGLLLM